MVDTLVLIRLVGSTTTPLRNYLSFKHYKSESVLTPTLLTYRHYDLHVQKLQKGYCMLNDAGTLISDKIHVC